MAELQCRMDAQEFAQWIVWLDAEQIGPGWDRFRHAQLLAAIHNGGRYEHPSKRPYLAQDFSTEEPWEEQTPSMPHAVHVQQLTLELAAMEAEFVAQ